MVRECPHTPPPRVATLLMAFCCHCRVGAVPRQDVVREHAPAGWRVKVASAGGGAERRIAAWLGGSILASLGSFHEMWVAKAEYEEHGHTILDRKCP